METEVCSVASFLENAAGRARNETLDGRRYVVVPAAMIVVGVHNGSKGPVFYGEDALAGTSVSWGMKPAVVYHPKPGKSGEATAARKEVIESGQVGFVMNTRMDGPKQRTDVWLDVLKADAVDPRILKSVRAGRPMEVSTGYHAELVENAGEHDGVPYKYVARRLQPDHFALLPDQIGACSIAAGAGLLVTNAAGGWDADPAKVAAFDAAPWLEKVQIVSEHLVVNAAPTPESIMDRKAKIDALITNGLYAEADRAELEKLPDGILGKIAAPAKVEPPKPAAVTNEVVPVPTFDQWLAAAPAPYRQFVTNGMNAEAKQKKSLVDAILAAPGNVLPVEVLNGMQTDVLEGIFGLLPAPVGGLSADARNYMGAAGGPVHNRRQPPPEAAPVLAVPQYS